MNKSKIVVVLGALTLTAIGCAPLPPCPTTPEKTPPVAALANKEPDGETIGDSNQKAKSGESRGDGSVQQKELTQRSKVEFQSPNQPPLPPACKPAS